ALIFTHTPETSALSHSTTQPDVTALLLPSQTQPLCTHSCTQSSFSSLSNYSFPPPPSPPPLLLYRT
ncbi:MAG: hypothetical protein ACK5KT_11845, partial [Dysgonomonas sp.]